MDSLISLCDVSKHYRTAAGVVRALDAVSLDIERGEFVAIVGRSGSGKSTLMNILGCLDIPTAGSYRFEGQDMVHCSERVRTALRGTRIGFVFQGFDLLPSLTALENVELPLVYRGVAREERRRRARESLCRVGLESRLTHRPAELSGGQQQRVAIARAIAMQPPLILADEPTGNLDSAAGRDIVSVLQTLHREGTTVILITHDLAIARSAQRQVTVSDGRVSV